MLGTSVPRGSHKAADKTVIKEMSKNLIFIQFVEIGNEWIFLKN